MFKKDFYLTHLVLEDFPKEGYKKLQVYTSTDWDYREGIYYFGINIHKHFRENDMEELENKNEIIKLPYPIEKGKYGCILVSADEKFYFSDLEEVCENENFIPSEKDLKYLFSSDYYLKEE